MPVEDSRVITGSWPRRTTMLGRPVRQGNLSLPLHVGLERCTAPQLGVDGRAFSDELFAIAAGSPSFISQRIQPPFQRRA
jgi:hypothetical protein